MRRLLVALALLGLAQPLWAQSVTVIQATPITNALFAIDGHVDGIEGLLGTSNTNTTALAAAVYTEDQASAEDTKGIGVMFRRHDANTSLVSADGDWGFAQLDASGNVKVAIISGGGTGGTSAVDNANFADNTSVGTPMMGVVESASPTTAAEGKLTIAALTLHRALQVSLYDTAGNALTASTDVAEDAAETNGVTGPIMMTVRRDTPAASAGTSGHYATPNTDAFGRLYTNAANSATTNTAFSTNATNGYLAATASTNATLVKSGSGNVYAYGLTNFTSTPYYLRMYNLSSSPTCSSATGFVRTIPIPADTSGSGIVISVGPGEGFSTGIAFCVTGGASSTDNTNAAAGVYVNLWKY